MAKVVSYWTTTKLHGKLSPLGPQLDTLIKTLLTEVPPFLDELSVSRCGKYLDRTVRMGAQDFHSCLYASLLRAREPVQLGFWAGRSLLVCKQQTINPASQGSQNWI